MAVKKHFVFLIIIEGIIDILPRHSRREGHKASRDTFRQTNYIRRMAQMPDGKHPARPAEARHDLIGYGDNIMLLTDGDQLVQQRCTIHLHTARPEHQRLKYECCYLRAPLIY